MNKPIGRRSRGLPQWVEGRAPEASEIEELRASPAVALLEDVHQSWGNQHAAGALLQPTTEPLGVGIAQDLTFALAGIGPHAVGGGSNQVMLRRMKAGAGGAAAAARGLAGHGAPLPEAVRARMEAAFGHDFSHVRVHTDGAARAAARGVNAVAFTVGADIAFGDGAWAPGSAQGDRVIAHELTHVVQHDEGRVRPTTGGAEISHPSDAVEREAVRNEATILSALSQVDAILGPSNPEIVGDVAVDALGGAPVGEASVASSPAAAQSTTAATAQASDGSQVMRRVPGLEALAGGAQQQLVGALGAAAQPQEPGLRQAAAALQQVLRSPSSLVDRLLEASGIELSEVIPAGLVSRMQTSLGQVLRQQLSPLDGHLTSVLSELDDARSQGDGASSPEQGMAQGAASGLVQRASQGLAGALEGVPGGDVLAGGADGLLGEVRSLMGDALGQLDLAGLNERLSSALEELGGALPGDLRGRLSAALSGGVGPMLQQVLGDASGLRGQLDDVTQGAAAATQALGGVGERLPGALQLAGGVGARGEGARRAAQRGVSGGGGRLPHLARIQRAFGAHDLSGVRAHTGGAAREAAQSIGASAFATGEDVAFVGTPDLHTAAHEATHVVQQRQGVSLPGGVGAAGDAYERHADAVAEAVVSGRSAEGLLGDAATADASPGLAVQMDMDPRQFQAYLEQQDLAGLMEIAEDPPRLDGGDPDQAKEMVRRAIAERLSAEERGRPTPGSGAEEASAYDDLTQDPCVAERAGVAEMEGGSDRPGGIPSIEELEQHQQVCEEEREAERRAAEEARLAEEAPCETDRQYLEIIERAERQGLPTGFMEDVSREYDVQNPGLDTCHPIPGGFGQDYADTSLDRIVLNEDTMQRALEGESSATGTVYHESTHAHLDIHADDPEVAALREAGVQHYRGAPLNDGSTADDPERIFEEAMGEYAGHRVSAYVHFKDRIAWNTARLDAGQATPEQVRSAMEQSVREFHQEAQSQTRGYQTTQGEAHTTRPMTPEMVEYVDRHILEGRVPSRAEDVPEYIALRDRLSGAGAEGQRDGSVQYAGGVGLRGGDSHRTAREGLRGGGGQLPHLERIQRSFGQHDIGGVRAHTGSPARQAARALGASAYASGEDVAFAGSPDLHTAAHEAAHVIQQRKGVSLPGGMGSVGDVHERHADAVADAVVAGRSAESLLSGHSGAAGGSAEGEIQARTIDEADLSVIRALGFRSRPELENAAVEASFMVSCPSDLAHLHPSPRPR